MVRLNLLLPQLTITTKIDHALNRQEAISTIINKIGRHLNSKEKYKKKHHLLCKTQDLAWIYDYY